MLILSRRIGEKLVIGGEVVISVLGGRGDSIRIGVEAPKHVSVDREEVHNKKVLQKMKARTEVA